jgi:excisionase family DNA binding protein
MGRDARGHTREFGGAPMKTERCPSRPRCPSVSVLEVNENNRPSETSVEFAPEEGEPRLLGPVGLPPHARADFPIDGAVDGVRSPWLTVSEAAARVRCGPKLIYREVRAGRLMAARVGGRRELRLLSEWIDDWLLRTTTLLRAASPIASRRGLGRD